MTDDRLIEFFRNGFDANKHIPKPTPWGAENSDQDFILTMRQHGFKPDPRLAIGVPTRMADSQDKGQDKTGWYIYFKVDNQGSDSAFGVGVFGTWRDSDSKIRWSSKQESYKTPVEREMETVKMAKHMAELKRIREDMYQIGAESAKQAFDSAEQANPTHQYIVKKNIKTHGIRQKDKMLLVPAYNTDGEMISVQRIWEDGDKKFWKDTTKKGGFFPIDGAKDAMFITTGFATGATIAEATGMMTIVAFDDGNLPEVASSLRAKYGLSQRIVIAADDDVNKPHNSGRTAGTKTAILINAEVKFPTTPTDFNDMAQVEGIEAVRDLLLESPVPSLQRPKKDGLELPEPTGVLALIAGYYLATAPKKQPIFATQAALAICSIVLARSYRTDQNNMTSMFFLQIGKSSSGKEHVDNTISKVLLDADMGHLIGDSGYTAAGGVMSALYGKPKHINIIDEFGIYLKSGSSARDGNHMSANGALMSAITKAHSELRIRSYSGGGKISKATASEVTGKKAICPAITLVGSTTDSTFFDAISGEAVTSGFLNRFIVAISDFGRMRPEKAMIMKTPQPIIDWIDAVIQREGNQVHNVDEFPYMVEIPFHGECDEFLYGHMTDYQIEQQELLEPFKIEEMAGRIREWAMRISLIVALSEDAQAKTVRLHHLKWGWDYVIYHYNRTIAEVKMRVSGSFYEADKKKVLAALRLLGKEGIKQAQMLKRPPFSEYKKKELMEILSDLQEASLADRLEAPNDGAGRPAVIWRSYDNETV